MGKVNQVADLDAGLTARTNWNEAMKEAETGATITGDGTVGNQLDIVVDNTPDLNSNSPIIPPSVAALKQWANGLAKGIGRTRGFGMVGLKNGYTYFAGFYDFDDAAAMLDNVSPAVNWGVANGAYGAEAAIVAGGAGVTDGTTLTITVTGTSIDALGVRTPGDTEVLVSDATTAALNDYFETTKKWLGEITFTLASDGALFSFDFNYGYVRYERFDDADFFVEEFEIIGRGNKNGTDFELDLLHHKQTGWTYAAAGFFPGVAPSICSMNTDYSPDDLVINTKSFSYKRNQLNFPVAGGTNEGVLIRTFTSVNDPIEFANAHISYTLQ